MATPFSEKPEEGDVCIQIEDQKSDMVTDKENKERDEDSAGEVDGLLQKDEPASNTEGNKEKTDDVSVGASEGNVPPDTEHLQAEESSLRRHSNEKIDFVLVYEKDGDANNENMRKEFEKCLKDAELELFEGEEATRLPVSPSLRGYASFIVS